MFFDIGFNERLVEHLQRALVIDVPYWLLGIVPFNDQNGLIFRALEEIKGPANCLLPSCS